MAATVDWKLIAQCGISVSHLFLIKSFIGPRILNKKSELVSKCRHYSNYKIKNVTRNDRMDHCSVLKAFIPEEGLIARNSQ